VGASRHSLTDHPMPQSRGPFLLYLKFFSIFGNTSYQSNRNIISVVATYKLGSVYLNRVADTIFINYNKIEIESSQEYISSIILHEMAHAVITYNNSSMLSQHQIMAFEYVNSISQTLMSIYPSMDLSSARSLALQGMGEDAFNSNFFKNLISSFGFNTAINDRNNWSLLAEMYKAGSIGKKQCD
jgi:hypothetical protein